MIENIGNIDPHCIGMYTCDCGKLHRPNEGTIDASRINVNNLIAAVPSPKITDAINRSLRNPSQ